MLLLQSTSDKDLPSIHHFHNKLLKGAAEMIASEVAKLVSSFSCTPYTMGVTCAPAFANYALLHKSLILALQTNGRHPPLAIGSDKAPTFATGREKIMWEDGMRSLRGLSLEYKKRNEGASTEMVDINTILDVQWYVEWRSVPPETSRDRVPSQVPVRFLLACLGFPSSLCLGEGAQNLDAAKAMVLPKFWREAEQVLGKSLEVFGLEVKLPSADLPAESLDSLGDLHKRKHGVQEVGEAETKPEAVPESRRGYKPVQTLVGHTGGVFRLAAAPDGTLFSGSRDGTIRHWGNGQCLATLEGHTDWVEGLLFDRFLFSGSHDSTVKQWAGGKCVATLHTASGVGALVKSEDGALYAGLQDGTIEQWRDGQYISLLKGHTSNIRALAIAEDGALFSGSRDRTVKEWRGGRCFRTFQEENNIYALALTADGAVFTASHCPSINRWQDGNLVASFHGECSLVLALALAPDGTLFSGEDNKIRQWHNGR